MLGTSVVWFTLTAVRTFYIIDKRDELWMQWWFIILMTFCTMIFLSAIKVHAGSIFPSDVILTMPACIISIGLCQVQLYFNHFDMDHSWNDSMQWPSWRRLIRAFCFIFVVLLSMLNPFLLFKKTPLWMANQISFYLFVHILYTSY